MFMMIATLSPLLWLACVSVLTVSSTGQEVEGTGSEASEGAVFSNAGYVELIVPLTSKVGVNLYGFYLGNLGKWGSQLAPPLTRIGPCWWLGRITQGPTVSS